MKQYLLASTVLGLSACLNSPTEPKSPPDAPGLTAPNFVLILTDDQRLDDLVFMPQVQALLVQQGTSFSYFFVSSPLCCPSRASLLRGEYVHNHNVWDNGATPTGGFPGFSGQGLERSTIATWLQGAGYRTALVGKYLNGYAGADSAHIPPGWSEWFAIFGPNGRSQPYYSYFVNENGTVRRYGSAPQDYVTDVLAEQATGFIRRAATAQGPFFLYLAPYAPHHEADPAPRHLGMFAGRELPRPPSFDEVDVSDKPFAISHRPRLTAGEIAAMEALYQRRLESLQAVDDAVAAIIGVLAETGQLDRTYILFLSDNGLFLGEHRLTAVKGQAYEEDIRVPLVVRGPGIPAGVEVPSLTSMIDVAPTIAALAGVHQPEFVDGRSLVDLLQSGRPKGAWRHALLVETQNHREVLRLSSWFYAENPNGEQELYDLDRDPYQLDNLAVTEPRAHLAPFAAWLDRLSRCRGETCRAFENAGFEP